MALVKKTTKDNIAVTLTGDAVDEITIARDTLTKELGFVPTWRQVVSLTLTQFNKGQRAIAE